MEHFLWGERLVGAHMSTEGGVVRAFERGETVGCTAIQIFAKNNNRWDAKPFTSAELDVFYARKEASSVRVVFSHAGYLINLAAPDESTYEKSLASMQLEMERAAALRLPFVVLHPGAHKGRGERWGIERVALSLNRLFEADRSSVKIALEVTAGQGSSLGSRFEELAEIIHRVDAKERLGVCVDSAHAFAAGYDFRSEEGYAAMWRSFENSLGFQYLLALHLNDSKRELGSRVDRHEHIGKGFIGLQAFHFLLCDQRFVHLPMVLETPKEDDPIAHDRANLLQLSKLLNKPLSRSSASKT